jgi:glutathione S-transferase
MLRSIAGFDVLAKASPQSQEERAMPRYVLYGHPESGHSYKVALALNLLGVAWEYHEVEVFAPRETRRADWRAASRYGEIPVLLVDDRPIVQSDAILLHLARASGRLGWEVDPDRLTEWMFWEANRVGISVPNLRLYVKFEPRDDALTAWLRARAEADLGRLDEELAGRPFLLGDRPSVADLACCGYLFFADQAGLATSTWSNVEAWLERIRVLPGWAHPYALFAAKRG